MAIEIDFAKSLSNSDVEVLLNADIAQFEKMNFIHFYGFFCADKSTDVPLKSLRALLHRFFDNKALGRQIRNWLRKGNVPKSGVFRTLLKPLDIAFYLKQLCITEQHDGLIYIPAAKVQEGLKQLVHIDHNSPALLLIANRLNQPGPGNLFLFLMHQEHGAYLLGKIFKRYPAIREKFCAWMFPKGHHSGSEAKSADTPLISLVMSYPLILKPIVKLAADYKDVMLNFMRMFHQRGLWGHFIHTAAVFSSNGFNAMIAFAKNNSEFNVGFQLALLLESKAGFTAWHYLAQSSHDACLGLLEMAQSDVGIKRALLMTLFKQSSQKPSLWHVAAFHSPNVLIKLIEIANNDAEVREDLIKVLNTVSSLKTEELVKFKESFKSDFIAKLELLVPSGANIIQLVTTKSPDVWDVLSICAGDHDDVRHALCGALNRHYDVLLAISKNLEGSAAHFVLIKILEMELIEKRQRESASSTPFRGVEGEAVAGACAHPAEGAGADKSSDFDFMPKPK